MLAAQPAAARAAARHTLTGLGRCVATLVAVTRSHTAQDLDLKYGADQVQALIIPVSLCMIVVVATIQSVAYYSTNNTQFVYSPYHESSSSSSASRFGGALLNVIIIIGIIVVMTVFLVVLYKYRCYKVIHGWLIMSSLLLLYFFGYEYLTFVHRRPSSQLTRAARSSLPTTWRWTGSRRRCSSGTLAPWAWSASTGRDRCWRSRCISSLCPRSWRWCSSRTCLTGPRGSCSAPLPSTIWWRCSVPAARCAFSSRPPRSATSRSFPPSSTAPP